jgi:hypothetical protein
MYVIYSITPDGFKEFFTGKTKRINGKRVATMTKHGDIKIYKKIAQVSKATLKLEKETPNQTFYAADYSEYLRERWRTK